MFILSTDEIVTNECTFLSDYLKCTLIRTILLFVVHANLKTEVEWMKSEKEKLLIRIAETVGELFQDIKKNESKREITFDQRKFAQLWDDYENWVDYQEKK